MATEPLEKMPKSVSFQCAFVSVTSSWQQLGLLLYVYKVLHVTGL